jgi:two-component system cell cycle sensor histidine kinase/response regulator CckA
MADPEGRRTVLVVEDDANLRRFLVRVLDSGGFSTLDTARATDALQLVREHSGRLALAVVDLMMPGVSGLDLGGDLDREYPQLKILYISGFVGSLAADALSRRAPDHLLLKPFTGETLLERVSMLLGDPQSASEGVNGVSAWPRKSS